MTDAMMNVLRATTAIQTVIYELEDDTVDAGAIITAITKIRGELDANLRVLLRQTKNAV